MTIAADVPAPTPPSAAADRPRLDYLPALDGIRGMGIVIVVLYHHHVSWLTAGELTVSMFFTLSGFLITRLMVDEWQRTDTVALGKFYERRARRLFPSSFIVLLGVVLVWTLFPGSGRRLGTWEWISGLTYWENIHLLFAGSNYQEMFDGAGKPLQHLWSLALEEQVYLVFPLVVIGLLRRRAPRSLWHLFGVLSGVAAIAFFLGWWYQNHGPVWDALPGVQSKCVGSSCSYYATEVRVGEFLVGAAFAVLWAVWAGAPRVTAWFRTRPGIAVGAVALAVECVMWWEVGFRRPETADWFFPWGVLLNALVVVVIMAVSTSHAGVCGLLSWKPLVYLGQITYTVYLVHWPTFIVIDSMDLDPSLPRWRIPVLDWVLVDSFWLFVLKAVVVAAIVLAIFYVVEDPVRKRRRWTGNRLWYGLAVLAIAGVAVLVIGHDRRSDASGPTSEIVASLDAEAIALQEAGLAALPEVPDDAPVNSAIDPQLPARLLMVGDSQSWVLAAGLTTWEESNGVTLEPSPGVGCGIGANTPLVYLGVEMDEAPGCTAWREALPRIIERFEPNMVVIVGGAADLSDRRIPGVDGWSHIGQAAYDEWLLGEMRSMVDVVTAEGAEVLWLTNPDIDPPEREGVTGRAPFDEADPERADRYNELIRQIADEDDRVTSAEFAAAVEAHPGGQFEPSMRPDGAHIDLAHAPELVDWLAEAIRVAHAG